MIAETLYIVGGYIAEAAACGFLGWQMKGATVKPEPSKPKQKSLADAIKAGYEAVEKMANDIHEMYHPIGCKCVMCQIRADDKDPEPVAGSHCALPCFNCSVITCPTHPDRKPATVKTGGITGFPVETGSHIRSVEYESRNCGPVKIQAGHKPSRCCLYGFPQAKRGLYYKCITCNSEWKAFEHGPLDIRWHRLSGQYQPDTEDRKDTAIQNLETQLKSLTEAYQNVVEERDNLIDGKGFKSAGTHIDGKPVYYIQTPRRSRRPLARSLYDSFVPNPDLTDRENMQALADHAKGIVEYRDALEDGVIDEIVAQRMARWDRLEKEERRSPGGRIIEQAGEGPVRYIPPKKRSPAGAQF